MKVNLLFRFIVILFLVSTSLSAEIRVGVAGSPPFVVNEGKSIEGVSIDLWEEMALQEKLQYTLIRFNSVNEVLQAVESGNIDLAIGSISITSNRLGRVSFTQPYYSGNMGLLSRRGSASIWNTIKPFLRTTFIIGVLTLLFVLFVVGNMIWLVERKSNDVFPESYLEGIGMGMWFAVVTFTTVGYGDLTPITRTGRLLTACWMIIALITASSMTAGIATSFTLIQLRHSSIESPESIKGERISVIRGTTGVEFVRRYGAVPVFKENLASGVKAVQDGEAVAMAFDYPVLKYYLKNNPEPDLQIFRSHEDTENYGFCTRRNSPLFQKINHALLKTLEKGELSYILKEWGV